VQGGLLAGLEAHIQDHPGGLRRTVVRHRWLQETGQRFGRRLGLPRVPDRRFARVTPQAQQLYLGSPARPAPESFHNSRPLAGLFIANEFPHVHSQGLGKGVQGIQTRICLGALFDLRDSRNAQTGRRG
jgi:hypothetical protein